MARSSSGLGRRLLKAKIAGSNPARATKNGCKADGGQALADGWSTLRVINTKAY